MNISESEGVRLLSFDGGDLRAISQLSILDEFMRRVEWDKKSTDRILPCEYFHMVAGVGTGGIIAIFLTILRMGIEETIQEFISVWQAVYADDTLDRTMRPVKLEETIKRLLRRKEIPETRRMFVENAGQPPCKVFVCAVPESNLGICEKFRNYKSRETSTNPTIVEAVRATCAIPKLFSPISIESIGCQVSYVTGAYNFNNPSREMIKEACEHFGKYRSVGFVVSLGAGQQGLLRVSTTNIVADSPDPTAKMAFDCDQVARDLELRLGELNAYHRLCVDRSLEYSGNSSNNPVGDIKAWTDGYLEQPDVMKKVDRCIASSQRLGDVILEQIALSQPQPTVEQLEQMQRELLPVRGSPHDAGNAHPTPLKVINAYGVQHVPCLQGTREKTLGAIRRWVDDEQSTAKSIFFLLDVAGSGKSTVAKHMAEEWKKERRLLARFFFSRDTAETMSTNSFCLTVANAFALLDNNFKAHMSKFTERPDFGLLSFEELFEGLVARPLRSVRRRAILIIDALDECDDEYHHRDELLSTLNSRLSSIPQLRILVTGRPERDIKQWAEEKLRVGYTDFNQLEKGSSNLEVYIKHRLQGLPDIQNRLYLVIRHAEGLFIWARVACDLIVNSTDVEALLEELGREVKLDHLYKTALAQSAPKDDASRRATVVVLQTILAARKPLSIEDMEGLCPRSEIVENVVTRLSSLLLYQSREDPVRLLHATLREFLTTQARAGSHFIQLKAGHCTLASGCLNLIGHQFKKENPDPRLLDATSKRKDIPIDRILINYVVRVFEYASTSWAYHCTNSYRKLALDEQILEFANNGLESWIRFIGQSAPHTITNYLHGLISLCRQKLFPQIVKRIVNRSLAQIVRISVSIPTR